MVHSFSAKSPLVVVVIAAIAFCWLPLFGAVGFSPFNTSVASHAGEGYTLSSETAMARRGDMKKDMQFYDNMIKMGYFGTRFCSEMYRGFVKWFKTDIFYIYSPLPNYQSFYSLIIGPNKFQLELPAELNNEAAYHQNLVQFPGLSTKGSETRSLGDGMAQTFDKYVIILPCLKEDADISDIYSRLEQHFPPDTLLKFNIFREEADKIRQDPSAINKQRKLDRWDTVLRLYLQWGNFFLLENMIICDEDLKLKCLIIDFLTRVHPNDLTLLSHPMYETDKETGHWKLVKDE